jgi:hypothetical protein
MGLVRQSPSGCSHSQKFLPLLLIDLFSFYLYRLPSDPTKQPIVLVPTKQFESFLWNINRKLGTSLRIPTGGKGAFHVTFDNDGTPQPRYLGRATNRKVRSDGLLLVILCLEHDFMRTMSLCPDYHSWEGKYR